MADKDSIFKLVKNLHNINIEIPQNVLQYIKGILKKLDNNDIEEIKNILNNIDNDNAKKILNLFQDKQNQDNIQGQNQDNNQNNKQIDIKYIKDKIKQYNLELNKINPKNKKYDTNKIDNINNNIQLFIIYLNIINDVNKLDQILENLNIFNLKNNLSDILFHLFNIVSKQNIDIILKILLQILNQYKIYQSHILFVFENINIDVIQKHTQQFNKILQLLADNKICKLDLQEDILTTNDNIKE